jgi:hypothetical protein
MRAGPFEQGSAMRAVFKLDADDIMEDDDVLSLRALRAKLLS